jgi:CDP-diacylglycerol--serine O-phosphatidyltransferase
MYEKKSSDIFTGLPSPGAAAALCTIILFAATEKGSNTLREYFRYLPIYATILGFLMVSQVPYLHFGKYLASARYHKERLLIIGLLLLAWLISSFLVNPFLFPFLLVNIYVVWGLIAYFALKMGFVKHTHPLVPEQEQDEDANDGDSKS